MTKFDYAPGLPTPTPELPDLPGKIDNALVVSGLALRMVTQLDGFDGDTARRAAALAVAVLGAGRPASQPAVTIRWVHDEQVDVEVASAVVASINHDEHGWSGMQAAIDLTRQLAAALGATVLDEGTPNL